MIKPNILPDEEIDELEGTILSADTFVERLNKRDDIYEVEDRKLHYNLFALGLLIAAIYSTSIWYQQKVSSYRYDFVDPTIRTYRIRLSDIETTFDKSPAQSRSTHRRPDFYIYPPSQHISYRCLDYLLEDLQATNYWQWLSYHPLNSDAIPTLNLLSDSALASWHTSNSEIQSEQKEMREIKARLEIKNYELYRIYDSTFDVSPKTNGFISIKWVLDDFGNVTSCELLDSEINDSSFEELIHSTVSNWTFGKSSQDKREFDILYKFNL